MFCFDSDGYPPDFSDPVDTQKGFFDQMDTFQTTGTP